MSLEEVIAVEEALSFSSFTHKQAFDIGLDALRIVAERQLRRIGVRIVVDDLLIFQYLMDGKNEDRYLRQKQATVLKTGHCSYYGYLMKESPAYDELRDNETYNLSGGGFPIRIGGIVRGALCISGMTDELDHALAVEVLRNALAQERNV